MKKSFITKILLSLVLILTLSSCSSQKGDENTSDDQKKNIVVTTSFLYDMVKNLIGDDANIEMIIPAGEDPHLYAAKSDDTNKIKNADLLVYHGLHFEAKMDKILQKTGKSVTEDFDQKEVGKMDEDGKEVIDPHFWFDIDLYKKATNNMAKYLSEAMPDEKEKIDKNLDSYLKKLDDLKKYNEDKLSQIDKDKRILITPHDAFNYFARSYDFKVVSPQGVSTESEVSNKDIDNVVNEIVDHKVKAIFAESTTDPQRMEKIKEAAKSKGVDVNVVSGDEDELFSDSLAKEGNDGDNYIDMYKHNVDLISENLK
ncbi:MAG: zinc ABC transporter substrate-binding protein [Tissierellia bacterium]|nr:zinc ABC transporter substrate-binding protein [Tissierellia bacterium]